MQFTVVAHAEQTARPAFIATKRSVPFKLEENARPDPSNSDEFAVNRALIDA